MQSKTLDREIPLTIPGAKKDLEEIKENLREIMEARTGKSGSVLDKYSQMLNNDSTSPLKVPTTTPQANLAKEVFNNLQDQDQEEIKGSVEKSRNIMEDYSKVKNFWDLPPIVTFKKLPKEEQEQILRELRIMREYNGRDLPTPRNDKEKEFLNIILKMFQIFRAKNTDYGSSFDELFDEFGMTSALLRLKDKYNRLKAIDANGDIQVKDESVQDTLMDMANYAILTILKLRESGK